MSATTAAVTSATAAANCVAMLYEIPTTDAACAVPSKGNYSDVMNHCCKVAKVQSYDNDCGLYCLAQEQSVGDLSSCLTSNGVKYRDAFCNHNQTATATAKVSSAESTGTSTASKTGTAASATSSGNAAVSFQQQSISKSGLGILALLFCSTVAGALM